MREFRIKRNLKFVLKATIIGSHDYPHQTYVAQQRLQETIDDSYDDLITSISYICGVRQIILTQELHSKPEFVLKSKPIIVFLNRELSIPIQIVILVATVLS